jgi:hypothetical protein
MCSTSVSLLIEHVCFRNSHLFFSLNAVEKDGVVWGEEIVKTDAMGNDKVYFVPCVPSPVTEVKNEARLWIKAGNKNLARVVGNPGSE